MAAASDLLVLYGSQTGCAEDVAHQVCAAAVRRHLAPRCMPMNEYDVRLLPTERFIIFVASTTGDGEVPDSMREFWRFLLRKDLPAGSLTALHHATFGLGDSSYPKYNFTAKRLHRRLEQLGSAALVPLGMGDDQDDLGIDRALVPWLATLDASLEGHHPIPNGLTRIPVDACLPARYEVSIDAGDEALPAEEVSPVYRQDNSSGASIVLDSPPSRQYPWHASVLRHTQLTTPKSARHVRHLEICLRGSNMPYALGDVIAVAPRNDETRCRQLLAALGIDARMPLRLRRLAMHAPMMSPVAESTTALDLFVAHLDIFSVPRRSFFALLAHFANDPMQRARLQEFGAPKGSRTPNFPANTISSNA